MHSYMVVSLFIYIKIVNFNKKKKNSHLVMRQDHTNKRNVKFIIYYIARPCEAARNHFRNLQKKINITIH